MALDVRLSEEAGKHESCGTQVMKACATPQVSAREQEGGVEEQEGLRCGEANPYQGRFFKIYRETTQRKSENITNGVGESTGGTLVESDRTWGGRR